MHIDPNEKDNKFTRKDDAKCVFFVRHGESQWNTEDKICGVTD